MDAEDNKPSPWSRLTNATTLIGTGALALIADGIMLDSGPSSFEKKVIVGLAVVGTALVMAGVKKDIADFQAEQKSNPDSTTPKTAANPGVVFGRFGV